MISNKKGFTLIELMGILTILALIVMIAVPISLNIIQTVKKSNFQTDVRNSLKSGDYEITERKITTGTCKPIGDIQVSHKEKFISGSICNNDGIASAKKLCTKEFCANGSMKDLVIKDRDPNAKPNMKYMGNFSYKGEFKSDDYRTKIEWIEIGSDSSIETKYETTSIRWDLSEDKDGSIMGGLVPIDGQATYELVIYGPNGIEANENSSYLFYGVTNVKNIFFQNFNTSNVTNMAYMFSNTYALTSLDLSSFNTSNVTNMVYMFYTAEALTNLKLLSFNTANVTDMSYMFSYTTAMKKIDVKTGLWNQTNANISSMFSGSGVSAVTYNP